MPSIELNREFNYSISLDPNNYWVSVGDTDVTTAIRGVDVVERVSQVAKIPSVRSFMKQLTRELAANCEQTGLVIEGRDITNLPADAIARLGIGYCPEERGIFSSLSAEENLMLPPFVSKTDKGMSVAEIYDMFPNLAERKKSQGTRLSGGEQQMLAVARILRTGAKLLLLDEISEGLAPVIVQALSRMITTLKSKGYTIVMVEQNFRFAAPLADRFYVVEHGQIVEAFEAKELDEKMPVLHSLLGV